MRQNDQMSLKIKVEGPLWGRIFIATVTARCEMGEWRGYQGDGFFHRVQNTIAFNQPAF